MAAFFWGTNYSVLLTVLELVGVKTGSDNFWRVGCVGEFRVFYGRCSPSNLGKAKLIRTPFSCCHHFLYHEARENVSKRKVD